MAPARKELLALLALGSIACTPAPSTDAAPADAGPSPSAAAVTPSATASSLALFPALPPAPALQPVPAPTPTPAPAPAPDPAAALAAALASAAPPPFAPAPTADPSAAPTMLAVPAEPSRYGKFELTVTAKGECQVSFRRTGRSTVAAFAIPDCGGDMLGVDKLAAAPRVGALTFPAVSADGDEFHLFSIATARGGNAVSGSDSWAVVVRNNDLWATSDAFADGELTVASLPSGTPAHLVLEAPATTTQAGARYTVTFGQATKTDLPKVASWVVSKKTQVLAGQLAGGYHATGFLPSISVDGSNTVVDDNGSCTLPAVGQAAGLVQMTAEVATWSDGRTTVKCISVVPAK